MILCVLLFTIFAFMFRDFGIPLFCSLASNSPLTLPVGSPVPAAALVGLHPVGCRDNCTLSKPWFGNPPVYLVLRAELRLEKEIEQKLYSSPANALVYYEAARKKREMLDFVHFCFPPS